MSSSTSFFYHFWPTSTLSRPLLKIQYSMIILIDLVCFRTIKHMENFPEYFLLSKSDESYANSSVPFDLVEAVAASNSCCLRVPNFDSTARPNRYHISNFLNHSHCLCFGPVSPNFEQPTYFTHMWLKNHSWRI